MSLINLWTRKAPEIAGFSFDAVLEDELGFSVTTPTYPVESGASISDHRIINPCKYFIRGVVSNTPITALSLVGGMAGGLVSNLTANPVVASISGLSAGFLASTNDTRASSALATLISLIEGAEPFDVETGFVTLQNMHVTEVRCYRDPETENALMFEMAIEEFITLKRLSESGQPSHLNLKAGSVEQGALAKAVSKGQATLKNAGKAVMDTVKGWLA